MIYLDNAGTTKMFEECAMVHKIFSCENFYNPSAMSIQSMQVAKQIAETEKYILNRLNASDGNILFTSCATESNNLAIKGSLRSGNWEYVFSAGEHPSVFNVAKKLELLGYKVHFVPLEKNGCVNLSKLESVLNEKTRLISIIHVSNETGAINDLKSISNLKEKKCPKAILHIDGVQGFMKIPFSLRHTSVDLYSFSGHKIHAPKGIAGLYVKNKNSLKEIFEGGGQQFGLRSGTENVSGIMQLKKSVELIDEKNNLEKVVHLRKIFNENLTVAGIFVKEYGFVEGCEKVYGKSLSPYIENLIFEGVKGETMLHALEENGVIVGLGSACSSKKAGNRVLEEIGLSKSDIISSVRISFNAYMDEAEVVEAGKIISRIYAQIKEKVS